MGSFWMACASCGALVIGLGAAAGAAEAAAAWPAGLDAALAQVVDREVEAGRLPGAVVMAGTPEAVRFSRAAGSLQLRPVAVPMTTAAIFDLASVTKVVGTTTAIMILVDDGLLTLDDTVAQHLPEWRQRDPAEDIRLHHLLTHTSGLPAYLSVGPLQAAHGPGPQPEVVIAAIAGLKLRRAVGADVEYSCLNAILAGRIAENVAGCSLHEFLTRRAFGPLGMADTGWHLTRDQRARLAPTGPAGGLAAPGALADDAAPAVTTHGLVHDPLARYYANPEHCAGNAGLFSTAADLARFTRCILGGGALDGVRIVRSETVERFTRRQTPDGIDSRGFGWDVWNTHPYQPKADTPLGRQAVGHFGFTGTMLWIDKDSGRWAVVLASRLHGPDDASVTALRRNLIQTLVEGGGGVE